MGKPLNTYAVRTSSGLLIMKIITLFPLDTRNSFRNLENTAFLLLGC